MKYHYLIAGLFGLVCALCVSCNEVVPIFVDSQDPPNGTIFYADQPLEFSIRTDAPASEIDTRVSITIVCDKTLFTREELPLMLIWEGPNIELKEVPISIPVRVGEKWLGNPAETDADQAIVFAEIPSLVLQTPTRYSLKIYGDDDKQEKIFGVMRVEVRLFENEQEEVDE